jgi:membrane protein YqaA with SNARE-associated domain
VLDSVFTFLSGSALWLLFSTGFLSATLLPGGSEIALVTSLEAAQYPAILLIAIATAGNTLGGMTNYLLGLWLPNRTRPEKRTRFAKNSHKALEWIHKYGYFALFFSWLPVIGDLLCLAAGWLRMHFLPCFVLIALGKSIRYSLLAALFYQIF